MSIEQHEANENRKNCPFCDAGHDMTFLEGFKDHQVGDLFRVKCMNCGAAGPATSKLLDAPLHWNFRGGFPAPRKGAA